VPADSLLRPEPLDSSHELEEFECGVSALDEYLKLHALSDQASEKSRTFVVCRHNRVVGYFSLSAASVEPDEATSRAIMGQGKHPVPAILIGRLAVDRSEQGRGIGEALLVEALAKAANAAETIGARVVLVHAIGEGVRSFYTRYGFEESPTNPLHLMMLMKDVRKSL
jgi:predicted N-acetyltransferase YhbS